MQNLEQVSDGFRFRTANGLAREQYGEPVQPMIELHLSYSKGYAGGRRRGILASLRHIEVGKTFTQTILFLNGNGCIVVRSLPRKNDRILHEVASAVDPMAERIVERFRAGDAVGAFEQLHAVCAIPSTEN